MPPGECFPWVLEHYFFHPKMQAPASFPCKPTAWVEGGSLWDLPSHLLNKSTALFACGAPTLPRQLCWDASTQELSAGGSSVTPVPSIAALLQGRSGTLLYI